MNGVKAFSFKELAMATKNFHDEMIVGQGGYGRVYKGILGDGNAVAIKRAKECSRQGQEEFHTEIELLSRVHHRNLVSLLGYCVDNDEQVYRTVFGLLYRRSISVLSINGLYPFCF